MWVGFSIISSRSLCFFRWRGVGSDSDVRYWSFALAVTEKCRFNEMETGKNENFKFPTEVRIASLRDKAGQGSPDVLCARGPRLARANAVNYQVGRLVAAFKLR